jgi:phosphonoacetate hydrolase
VKHLLFLTILGCSGKSDRDVDTENGDDPITDGDDSASECLQYPWLTAVAGEAIESIPGAQVEDHEFAQQLANTIVEEPHIAAVLWREASQYYVRTASIETHFSRTRDADGNWSLMWADTPPLNTDPMADTTLGQELGHANPAETVYAEHGYEEGDTRLSFPSIEDASFPHLKRRFSSLFDGANSPNMAVVLAPYASGGMGSHGDASATQSRAPLVLRGPGVKAGTLAVAANHVDIAPTVAGLLGVEPVTGVDGRSGRWTSGQMLAWQDGEVLTDAMDEQCAYGAAKHALVLILDGLNHNEMMDGVAAGRYPNLARIADDRAAIFSGGSVVGWPSFSLPGHVSIFTGAWQGHHGMVSNSFYDRETGESGPGVSLAEMLANREAGRRAMDQYLSSDVETLFEAVARSSPDGVIASVNELTTRGVTWNPAGSSMPAPPTDIAVYALADQAALLQVSHLFEEVGPPTLMAVSLYVSDAAGQDYGPHGDDTRTALEETDVRVGQILDQYQAAGVFEDTVFVLTADHGMELMDSSRTASWAGAVDGVMRYDRMLYLP